MTRRPSRQTVAVLSALATEPGRWRYGYELGQEVDLKAGSLYPILIRLCDRGLLDSAWETDPPAGRPPRHLYRLTGAGVRFAAEAAPAEQARTTTPRPDSTQSLPAIGLPATSLRHLSPPRSAW